MDRAFVSALLSALILALAAPGLATADAGHDDTSLVRAITGPTSVINLDDLRGSDRDHNGGGPSPSPIQPLKPPVPDPLGPGLRFPGQPDSRNPDPAGSYGHTAQPRPPTEGPLPPSLYAPMDNGDLRLLTDGAAVFTSIANPTPTRSIPAPTGALALTMAGAAAARRRRRSPTEG